MTLEEKAYEYAKYDDNGRVSVNDDKFKAYIEGAKEMLEENKEIIKICKEIGADRLAKENAELKAQIEKMKTVLELAYKSLCRYETNINGVGITITVESEKDLFVKWLKEVEHLIGKE